MTMNFKLVVFHIMFHVCCSFTARPCELHCRNRGAFHSIKVLDEVIDGTPCREGHNDVCIGGKCEVCCRILGIFNDSAKVL